MWFTCYPFAYFFSAIYAQGFSYSSSSDTSSFDTSSSVSKADLLFFSIAFIQCLEQQIYLYRARSALVFPNVIFQVHSVAVMYFLFIRKTDWSFSCNASLKTDQVPVSGFLLLCSSCRSQFAGMQSEFSLRWKDTADSRGRGFDVEW